MSGAAGGPATGRASVGVGHSRRLAITLSALAFLWACTATVYLLMASSRRGLAASAMLGTAGEGASGMPPPLSTADGVWMAALLLGVTLLAGIPMGIGLAHPSGHRATAWTIASLLVGFSLVSGGFVGLLYLPSTILLIVAGAVRRLAPQGAPLADSRA